MADETPNLKIPYLGSDDALKDTTTVARDQAYALEQEMERLERRIDLESGGGGGGGGGTFTIEREYVGTSAPADKDGKCWYSSTGYRTNFGIADENGLIEHPLWAMGADMMNQHPPTSGLYLDFGTLVVTRWQEGSDSHWVLHGQSGNGTMQIDKSALWGQTIATVTKSSTLNQAAIGTTVSIMFYF